MGTGTSTMLNRENTIGIIITGRKGNENKMKKKKLKVLIEVLPWGSDLSDMDILRYVREAINNHKTTLPLDDERRAIVCKALRMED